MAVPFRSVTHPTGSLRANVRVDRASTRLVPNCFVSIGAGNVTGGIAIPELIGELHLDLRDEHVHAAVHPDHEVDRHVERGDRRTAAGVADRLGDHLGAAVLKDADAPALSSVGFVGLSGASVPLHDAVETASTRAIELGSIERCMLKPPVKAAGRCTLRSRGRNIQ